MFDKLSLVKATLFWINWRLFFLWYEESVHDQTMKRKMNGRAKNTWITNKWNDCAKMYATTPVAFGIRKTSGFDQQPCKNCSIAVFNQILKKNIKIFHNVISGLEIKHRFSVATVVKMQFHNYAMCLTLLTKEWKCDHQFN